MSSWDRLLFYSNTQLVASAKSRMRGNNWLSDCHKKTKISMHNDLIRVILWWSSCLNNKLCKHVPYTVCSHKQVSLKLLKSILIKITRLFLGGELNPLQYKQQETMSDRCEWEDRDHSLSTPTEVNQWSPSLFLKVLCMRLTKPMGRGWHQ